MFLWLFGVPQKQTFSFVELLFSVGLKLDSHILVLCRSPASVLHCLVEPDETYWLALSIMDRSNAFSKAAGSRKRAHRGIGQRKQSNSALVVVLTAHSKWFMPDATRVVTSCLYIIHRHVKITIILTEKYIIIIYIIHTYI